MSQKVTGTPGFLYKDKDLSVNTKKIPAYIEVAEFDCLHDDGVLYAKLLKDIGIPVKLFETKGTMHGFDTKLTAPTTRRMIKNRIKYIRKMFST